MRALVTNDDGIASPGLVTLAAAASGAGFDVVVAAPRTESSGSSAESTELAAAALPAALALLNDVPPGTVLNVNVPNRPPVSEVTEVTEVELGV